MDRGTKRFLGGLMLVGSVGLGAALEANLSEDAGAWTRFAIAGLVAFAFAPGIRLLDAKSLPEFVTVKKERANTITSSQWNGEMVANESAIRAALLSCDWKEHSWIYMRLIGGVTLEVEREAKGWRFTGSSNGNDRDRTIVRSTSAGEPRVSPPFWKLWADEPGDLFELSEVEEIFATFADKGSVPSFAKWQVINLN